MQQADIPPPPGPNEPLLILMDAFIIFVFIGAIIFWLHNHKKPHQGLDISDMRISPTTITVVMLVIAVLGPAAFNIYIEFGSIYLMGMCWQISNLTMSGLTFTAAFFLISMPFMFFRLVFVYQIYKYYRLLTTKKRTVIVGIIGEIQFPITGLLVIPFAISDPNLAVIFSIPVPILLVVGLAILHYVKTPRPVYGWEELDKTLDWWDKEQQIETDN